LAGKAEDGLAGEQGALFPGGLLFFPHSEVEDRQRPVQRGVIGFFAKPNKELSAGLDQGIPVSSGGDDEAIRGRVGFERTLTSKRQRLRDHGPV
jgi:hypothetical protein